MLCSVVVNEEELRAHNTFKKTNMREENLGIIAGTSNWSSLEDVEDSTATKYYTSSNKNNIIFKQVF